MCEVRVLRMNQRHHASEALIGSKARDLKKQSTIFFA
jgi:hypothetical protein